MSIRRYKDYFHGKAVKHKLLLHNPASDGPDGPLRGKRFTLFNQEEVITGLRSEIPETPVLHLHLYDRRITDNEAYDQRNVYTAGFMVTQHASLNDIDEQLDAYDTCEQITDDLIDAMIYDYQNLGRCTFPLGIIDWNTLDVSFVGPLWNSRFGCFATFKYQVERNALPDAARIDAAFPNQIHEEQYEDQYD